MSAEEIDEFDRKEEESRGKWVISEQDGDIKTFEAHFHDQTDEVGTLVDQRVTVARAADGAVGLSIASSYQSRDKGTTHASAHVRIGVDITPEFVARFKALFEPTA
jgi:hypothetical protein